MRSHADDIDERAGASRLTGRGVAGWSCALAAAALPALFAGRIAPALDAAYGEVDPQAPYLALVSPALSYVAMPLVVAGSIALVLAPGLLWCLALGAARGLEEWLLKGLALSLVVLSAAVQAVQAAVGEPLVGGAFALTAVACAAAGGLAAWWRVRRGATLPCPGVGWPALLRVFAVPLLFLIVLLPKFFWESFNGDGAHAYEASRLLLRQATPFWPADSGEGGLYPGWNTFLFTYPTAWFLRLFGEYEASARLPLVPYLAVLYAAVVAVATAGRPGLGRAGRALVWAGVVSFGLVMSYSATYDPYCADIALPATQDTLLMICFLGAVLGFERRQWGWAWLFTWLAMLCSPAGLLLALAWLVAVAVAWRPVPWAALARFAFGVAVGVAMAAVAPAALEALGQNPPGVEHTAGQLLRKFRFVIPFDAQRLLFLVVPSGCYAVLGLLAWRRLDAVARALWLVTGALFGLYYLLAFVSLHYFAPAMVLPLVAFWRHHRPARWRLPALGLAGCAAGAAVALLAGTPTGPGIHTAGRQVGELLEVRGLPDYRSMERGYLRAPGLLVDLFPKDWDPSVPERRYGGSPLVWNHYAHRPPPGGRRPNYVLTAAGATPPAGATLLSARDGAALWVRDLELLERHRRMQPVTSRGRALYTISRNVLFRRSAAHDEYLIVDLGAWRDWLLGR